MEVTALLWILYIVCVAISIALVVVVLMQDSKSSGLGSAFGGNTDSFFGRNKSKTREGKLIRMTKILGAVLGVFSIVAVIISRLITA